MSHPLDLKFMRSADRVETLPDTNAEVAFLGRSNVGKSSLLNALANRKRLAHVSKSPGRTQLLNCFELREGVTIMDCPGYGYAAVPGNVRSSWQRMMENYLIEREELVMTLVLVDGEIGPTKLDIQMLDWLRSTNVPFTVVASKHDKVKASKRGHRRKELALRCGIAASDVMWVSSAKNLGINELRDRILMWLADGEKLRD